MASDGFLTRGIEYIKEYLQDSLEAKRWTNARLVTLLGLANRVVYEDLLKATDPRSVTNLAESTLDIVASTKDYGFPANLRKFRRLVKRDSTSGVVTNEILPADPMSDRVGLILLDRRRGLRIFPTPDADDSGWTLEYEAGVVPGLLEAPGSSTASSYVAASKTLKLGTATYGVQMLNADWYNNCWIRICSHASGTAVGEQRRIVDYAADGTFTLESAFTNALDTTPSEWTFEILPCLDNPLDHAIILRAVMLIHSSGGNYKGRGLINEEYKDVLKAALCDQIDNSARTGPAMSSDFMDPSLTESYL